MQPLLVTGGAGYIGAHTCKLLASAGYQPIVYDNLSTGHRDFVRWGPLVVGDLADTEKLIEVFDQYRPVAVVHFAANAYVSESISNPFKYYLNNIGGTLSLLEAMRVSGVDYLVFSSTCATYGIPDCPRIIETTPQIPINPYGMSKLMVEQILCDLANADNKQLKYVALRYFNAAGATPSADIGELHNPETHLIPLAIHSAYGGEVLRIFGNDFDTPDGTAVRDYVHVEDLAHGHLCALQYLLSDGASETINLGSGYGTSVREIIATLQSLGITVQAASAPRREGDPAYLVADTNKAQKLLGWSPRYINISDILKTALNWHQKRL